MRVMMPAPERGLEQHGKDAEKRGRPAQRRASSAPPNTCGHAQAHVDFTSCDRYLAPGLTRVDPDQGAAPRFN